MSEELNGNLIEYRKDEQFINQNKEILTYKEITMTLKMRIIKSYVFFNTTT